MTWPFLTASPSLHLNSIIVVSSSRRNTLANTSSPNHIGAAGGVSQAVRMAKEYAPFVRKIEVEVENLDMVREAADALVSRSLVPDPSNNFATSFVYVAIPLMRWR